MGSFQKGNHVDLKAAADAVERGVARLLESGQDHDTVNEFVNSELKKCGLGDLCGSVDENVRNGLVLSVDDEIGNQVARFKVVVSLEQI